MVTTERRYVMADLLEVPDDDNLYDIVGGKLIVYNVPDLAHGLVASGLSGLLWDAYRAGYGTALTNLHAVALDFPAKGWAAEYVTHPDHSFIRRGREGILGQRAVEGAPDLVVEVLSPSTRDEHATGGSIRAAYELFGVPHYWLVDLEHHTVEQYTLVGEPYAPGSYGDPVRLGEGDVLTSPLFPTVSMPVTALFQYPRGRPPQ